MSTTVEVKRNTAKVLEGLKRKYHSLTSQQVIKRAGGVRPQTGPENGYQAQYLIGGALAGNSQSK